MENTKLLWTDETSYAQGDKERIPRILVTPINGFKIKIHRHIHYPDTWLLTAHDIGINDRDLKTDDFEQAEDRALRSIFSRLEKYVGARDALKEVLYQ